MGDGWFEADVVFTGLAAIATTVVALTTVWVLSRRRQNELEVRIDRDMRRWRENVQQATDANTRATDKNAHEIDLMAQRVGRVDARLADGDTRHNELRNQMTQILHNQGEISGRLDTLIDLTRRSNGG